MKELPFMKCVGFDLSKYHIDLGKEKYPGIELKLCNMEKALPVFDWNGFDCVLCAGILMHILPSKIDFVIKEIRRISSKAIFLYEQDKSKEYGLRHPNNFVFYHDYDYCFCGLEKVFEKDYEGDHIANGFLLKPIEDRNND